MKQITTKSGDIIVIEIPKEATWWKIDDSLRIEELGEFFDKMEVYEQMFSCGLHTKMFGKLEPTTVYYRPDDMWLPKGNWEILNKLSELSDEDCEEFVIQYGQDIIEDFIRVSVLGYYEIVKIHEDKTLPYKNYMDNTCNNYTLKAKESFISLLQSQGIDTSKELIIIKKL